MSWFFGKKKHQRESPPDTPEEVSPGGAQSDGYVIIEKEENVGSPASGSTGGLYPHLAPFAYPPESPQQQQQQNQSVDSQSYISGIPFRLNKTLDADLEIDRLKIDEITSFVHRIKCEDYDYEFSLERSVMNEMGNAVE